MALAPIKPVGSGTLTTDATVEASRSAVSWAAIIAGAVASSALGFLLLLFGAGLGLSSVSPWPGAGATATTFAISSAIWLIIVQWVSSGFGGYLTGRLRTHWVDVHTDEVFFRDTAHGFLSWALATLVTVSLLASATGAIVGGGAQAIGGAASSAIQGGVQGAAQSGGPSAGTNTYLVDTLFRQERPDVNASSADAKAEAGRILATSLANGSLSATDRTYLAGLVSSRTGIAQPDAEKRVDDLVNGAKAAADKARAAADEARKVTGRFAFFAFFSMLIGAFVASAAAALGGRNRDE